MRRKLNLGYMLIAVGVMLAARNVVLAQCPPLPHLLSNGQIVDATQLMANFNAAVDCVNNKGTVDSGTAGQISTYAAAGTTVSSQSLSSLLDSAIGSAQGTILYRGSTGWTPLAPGTAGQVLRSGGPSANPSWVAAGSGPGGMSILVGAGISGGTSTVGLSSIPPISRPALASLTWLNQAGATATDYANGPLVLRTTENTTGHSVNALVKAVAGASWTVTIQYSLGNRFAGNNLDMAGLVVYNSVNGRIYASGIASAGTIDVWAYNSTTSWSAAPGSKSIVVNFPSIWTRAQYVSGTTTLTFSYSIDGFTWETIFTTNAPFVGVPTHYGILVGSRNNTGGYVLSLNYLKDSTP